MSANQDSSGERLVDFSVLHNESQETATAVNQISLPELGTLVVTTKPIVYTFHIQRHDTIPLEEKVYLDVWGKRWNEAGYDARVLFLEDAMKHSDFANLSSSIDQLLTASGEKRDPELRFCYLRYLAMVVSGGGMMVDIDSRPATNATNEKPPDTFTLYCGSETGKGHGSQSWLLQPEYQSGLPFAASGSADAWLRVSQRLPWAFEQNDDKSKWTDSNGLFYLAQFGEVVISKEWKVKSLTALAFDKCAFRT